ncbi:MAG: rhamnan synthesis F family protein [Acetobacter papayae]
MKNEAQIAPFFDENYYALTADAKKLGLSPLEHYLQVGEAQGIAPSRLFNPQYYASRYPDVATSSIGLLQHFALYGHAEGRVGAPVKIVLDCPTDTLQAGKENILLLLHDASRTGAPILGWNILRKMSRQYNVITVLLEGGPIEEAIRENASATITLSTPLGDGAPETRSIAQTLIDTYRPLYAIANSAATRHLAVALEEANLPVIALVHEFTSTFTPLGTLNPLFIKTSRLVFPAEIVFAECRSKYSYLRGRDHTILRQGPSIVPPSSTAEASAPAKVPPKDDRFTVVGMGTITYRKGVDAFIAAAATLKRDLGRDDFRFIWVGDSIPVDWRYHLAVEEQVAKSGLADNFVFLGEVSDLDPAYDCADVFFLSSRLDPLPNVAIDAALKGLPIISFDDTNGMGEILAADPATRDLVVPYMDSTAAARLIAELIDDRAKLEQFSSVIRSRATTLFDMDSYVASIDALGRQAIQEREQIPTDLAVITQAEVFEPRLYFGRLAADKTPEGGIVEYLNNARLARPLTQPDAGLFIRRPFPGFNPLIYALNTPEVETTGEDPLAHFLNAGRPEGPWLHPVVFPGVITKPANARVAIHGHFYYADLVPDFLHHLAANAGKADLFLTTSGPAQEEEIRSALAAAGITNAEVWSVPNKGRDIGPFLVDMPQRLAGQYDIVGHVHGKRSRHVDQAIGERWREFAWQHLIGDKYPMMDLAVSAFAENPALGMVFPEDPHLNGWDQNRAIAEVLAPRMGLEAPLPVHFDFPIGTMFWARPEALQPMFDLGLGWDDFPPEPLPIDGTILHTLERLLTFAVRKAGYTYATTYVAESSR